MILTRIRVNLSGAGVRDQPSIPMIQPGLGIVPVSPVNRAHPAPANVGSMDLRNLVRRQKLHELDALALDQRANLGADLERRARQIIAGAHR